MTNQELGLIAGFSGIVVAIVIYLFSRRDHSSGQHELLREQERRDRLEKLTALRAKLFKLGHLYDNQMAKATELAQSDPEMAKKNILGSANTINQIIEAYENNSPYFEKTSTAIISDSIRAVRAGGADELTKLLAIR